MVALATQVSTVINANQAETFARIAPIDLTSIFTGYGPLPAVIGTKDQTGRWDEAGQTRTVELSDGSTAQEKLDVYTYPSYFSYTVSNFSGSLRFLTTSANGEWWFEQQDSGKTNVKWRYAFHARSVFAVPILWFIATVLWHRYMAKALALAKKQTEVSP
ncbi:MAG: SRPBCC family protein [Chloroflexota bacterium]